MDTFELLVAHDIKPSVQRIAIMDYLKDHRTHPTADEIYNAIASSMPTLSKTTVYNTLRLFTEHGVAQSLTIDEETEHFDGDISVHGHFMCKKCGTIYDVFISKDKVPGRYFLKKEGFTVDETHLYYKGVCKKCQDDKK